MKKALIRTFRKFINGSKGFLILIKEESSLIIHILVTIAVIIAGVLVKLTFLEWAVIILVVGMVIGFEIMNTGLEYLADVISFKYDVSAKKIKDLGAAATLFVSIISVAIGLLIFIPKLIGLKTV